MNLALFDFDGTITSKDSFVGFIRYAAGTPRFYMGLFVLSPFFYAHRFGILPIWKLKEIFIRYFFKGWKRSHFDEIALEYSKIIVPRIIRPKAMDKIAWHRSQEDTIVVVSASIDSWLKPWCDENDLAHPFLSSVCRKGKPQG